MKLVYRYQLNRRSKPQQRSYSVNSVNHALDLAAQIAQRDMSRVDWNMFDLEVKDGESWESDDGESFDELMTLRDDNPHGYSNYSGRYL